MGQQRRQRERGGAKGGDERRRRKSEEGRRGGVERIGDGDQTGWPWRLWRRSSGGRIWMGVAY